MSQKYDLATLRPFLLIFLLTTYVKIFHKIEVQTVILRWLKYLNVYFSNLLKPLGIIVIIISNVFNFCDDVIWEKNETISSITQFKDKVI